MPQPKRVRRRSLLCRKLASQEVQFCGSQRLGIRRIADVVRQPTRPGLSCRLNRFDESHYLVAFIERTWLAALNAPKEPCVQQRRSISRINALNRLGAGELVRASRDETFNSNRGGLQIANDYGKIGRGSLRRLHASRLRTAARARRNGRARRRRGLGSDNLTLTMAGHLLMYARRCHPRLTVLEL